MIVEIAKGVQQGLLCPFIRSGLWADSNSYAAADPLPRLIQPSTMGKVIAAPPRSPHASHPGRALPRQFSSIFGALGK